MQHVRFLANVDLQGIHLPLSLSRSLTHIDVVVAAAVQHHSCREHGLARHYEDTDDNHELKARYNQSNIGTLSNG